MKLRSIDLVIIVIGLLGIVAVLSFSLPQSNAVTGVVQSRNAEITAEAERALNGN
ncbi:MAG: hypothetical protein AAB417_02895 [Patescibacteria group bacterium]